MHFFFICYELTNGNISYTFIPQSKTWDDAQQHCMKDFHDLAYLADHAHLGAAVRQRDFPVWIGLHKEGKDKHK